MKKERYSLNFGSLGEFLLELDEKEISLKKKSNYSKSSSGLIRKMEKISKERDMTPADFIRISLRLGFLLYGLEEGQERLVTVDQFGSIKRDLSLSKKSEIKSGE